ncbi:MAG: ABC transporter permease [Planctomycetota bacterium]
MNAKVAGVLGLLIFICIFLAVTVPESFLSAGNLENLLKRTAMFGVLGIGVAFVIITSGIDLSIGSVVCLVGCLLAMFLQVTYDPIGVCEVQEVRAAEKQILLNSKGDFVEGDTIRYYGGRRAKTAIVTITDVSEENGNTLLTLDQAPSRDDSVGRVAKTYKVSAFTDGDASSTVTLADDLQIEARDKISFVHPDGGLKMLVITGSEGSVGNKLTLNDSLGKFDATWLAIPQKRRQRMPVLVGVASVLGIALVLGLLHGLLVTKQNLPPFVVTLCGLLFYRGISRWMVSDQTVGFGNEFEASLSRVGSGKLPILTSGDEVLFGIPYAFFIMLFIAIAASIFLNKTIWGRYMLALGHNEQAARYSGINTGRVTVIAYVICTLLAAVGGILFALDSNSVAPSSFGNFFELYAIAAAVLGGCSLRGGQGGILGVVVGTALMQVLYNLIVLLKISDKLEFAIIGAVILLGVMTDEFIRNVAQKRRARMKA